MSNIKIPNKLVIIMNGLEGQTAKKIAGELGISKKQGYVKYLINMVSILDL
jgi:hypothetical protein